MPMTPSRPFSACSGVLLQLWGFLKLKTMHVLIFLVLISATGHGADGSPQLNQGLSLTLGCCKDLKAYTLVFLRSL